MSNKALSFIDWLLKQQVLAEHASETVVDWTRIMLEAAPVRFTTPEKAISVGYLAADLSAAFAIGYQTAIQCLIPGLPKEQLYALCVTEDKGASPKVMETRLTKKNGSLYLSGTKSFVTMGNQVDELLVLAVCEENEFGQKGFTVVRVPFNAAGVMFKLFDTDLPFVPRVTHAAVMFDEVLLRDNMAIAGEGYKDLVTHFRPIEDIHVFSAVMGYLWQIAVTYQWSESSKEQILSILALLAQYELEVPVSHSADLVNAGIFARFSHLLKENECEWDKVDQQIRRCWDRDVALLDVASVVRAKRKEKAWSQVNYS